MDLDDWLTVHRSITLFSNMMHKVLIYLHITHLSKSSRCFEHYPTHLQEVYVVIVQLRRRPPEDEQGNARNM